VTEYINIEIAATIFYSSENDKTAMSQKTSFLGVVNIRTSKHPTLIGKHTRNSSKDEIANVNFLYDDIVHVL